MILISSCSDMKIKNLVRFRVTPRESGEGSTAYRFSSLSVVCLFLTVLKQGQTKFVFDVFPIHLIHSDLHPPHDKASRALIMLHVQCNVRK